MRCPNCGQENPEEARFCGGCGSPLPEPPAPVVAPARGLVPWWLVVMTVIVGLFGACVVVLSQLVSYYSSTERLSDYSPTRIPATGTARAQATAQATALAPLAAATAQAQATAMARVSVERVEEAWVARYNGPRNGDDWPKALAVDGAGNVYVTGASYSSEHYGTIKYGPDGSPLWVARYSGPGEGYDWVEALAVDSAGNVYVTGKSDGSSSWDYATVKYGPDGTPLWVARYNGPNNNNDEARALAVDGAGNVYVSGSSTGSGTGEDYATIKYGPNGAPLWVARYNGPGNGGDGAKALAVDGAGNVYVTGTSYVSNTNSDYATIEYGSDGAELWVARYNGPGNGGDWARALAVDGAGNVYVTGSSTGSGTGGDYATIKYGPGGR